MYNERISASENCIIDKTLHCIQFLKTGEKNVV